MSYSVDHGGAEAHAGAGGHASHGRPYLQLLLWFPVHVAVMYVLMFAMIDRASDFWNNINMLWMAVLMAAPMNAIMVLSMRSMYADTGKTVLVLALSAVLGLGSWLAIRQQWGVGDAQFLRSMIPHHSGAILMCREASITDPRIAELCQGIEAGQREEVQQMETLLAEQ